jgi:hypothetical protein
MDNYNQACSKTKIKVNSNQQKQSLWRHIIYYHRWKASNIKGKNNAAVVKEHPIWINNQTEHSKKKYNINQMDLTS